MVITANFVWIVLILYVAYLLFIQKCFSRYKNLPTAKQPHLLCRLFHEPTTFELERWMQTTPNNGLIRFFGFLNQERLLMAEPEILKQVMQRDAYKFDKLPWLASVQSAAGVTGLVSSKGHLHKVHRKYTIAAFNSTSVRSLYPQIWKVVLEACDSLFQRSSIDPIKLNPLLQLACLDISMRAGFNIDVDVFGNTDEPLVKSYCRPFRFGERAPLYMKLLQICPVPLQLPVVRIVSRALGISVAKMRTIVGSELLERLEVIRDASRLPKSTRPPDILDLLLYKSHEHLSERALLQHAMTTMAANLEMVSNQLAWALYALSHPRNLHIQAQLRNEIRTNFRNSPETVSWETICSQPYLLGVINEILRLYPNVSHRGRVSNTSTTLQDLPLSKGTILVWPVYAINRDPKHWGPDASEFKPERWFAIEASNEDIPRRDAFAFMTFGQGPRKCPGEQYTRAVMACMLLNLIGRYEFGRVEGHPDVIEEDNGERVAFGIVMKADIWVNVKEVPGWIDTTTAR